MAKGSPKHSRSDYLAQCYGITEEEYLALFDAQKGKCAICGGLPQKKRLCIDHDHKTDRIRGLLCPQCNTLLGMAKDSPARLFAAIRYLKNA